jgi:hypothetical protein
MTRLRVPALLTLLAAAPPGVRGAEGFDLYEAKIALFASVEPRIYASLLGDGELRFSSTVDTRGRQYFFISGKELRKDVVVESVVPRDDRFAALIVKVEEPKEADGVDLWEQRSINLKGITKP